MKPPPTEDQVTQPKYKSYWSIGKKLDFIHSTIANYSLSHQALIDERKTLRQLVHKLTQENNIYLETLKNCQDTNKLLKEAMSQFIYQGRELIMETVKRLDEAE